MKNNFFNIKRTPTRRAVTIFSLLFLVVLLTTLSAGLIWCQPASGAASTEASPVGTWISADVWELGIFRSDTVVEFSSAGLMTIAGTDFSALYQFDNGTLELFDIDSENSASTNGDQPVPSSFESFRCVITGDHMSFYGRITGIHSYHGRCDLIRISGETGLTEEQIAELIQRT